MQQVYVGLSGGVDSSVTAALLRDAGYKVTGVFMKNWSKDLPGFECPWFEEYQDAKRVAVQLRIPFKMFDFQQEYAYICINLIQSMKLDLKLIPKMHRQFQINLYLLLLLKML